MVIGKRYYYEENELKEKEEQITKGNKIIGGQNIEGLEVDFEVIDGKAVGVFILNKPSFSSNFSSLNTSFNASMTNLPNIDTKFVFLDFNAVKILSLLQISIQ